MRKLFRAIFILMVLLCITNSSTLIKTSEGNDLTKISSLLIPLNQRLANEKTSFQYSPIIDEEINNFINKSNIVGVSVAIVKDERLVFVKGYGDSNFEEKTPTTPANLFRIASVSKLITAVAIMKLVEAQKITLQTKVFGPEGIINDQSYYNKIDPNMNEITIENLLNHSGGWTQRYGDPMFNPLLIAEITGDKPPVTINTYLKFVSSRRLHFKPGTVFSYSNMGYVFLGEVIKRVSGIEYEQFVNENVLYPLGIYDMHIGSSYRNQKRNNEVCYYENEATDSVFAFNGSGELVRRAYGGNNIELLGAAGGWIASAPELARLLVSIDGFDKIPNIISDNSLKHMSGEFGESFGWRNVTKEGNWYRTGTLAGTSAILMRRPDGIEWVVLCNSSNWRGPHLTHEIDKMMTRVIFKVKEWPENNLFNYEKKVQPYDPIYLIFNTLKSQLKIF